MLSKVEAVTRSVPSTSDAGVAASTDFSASASNRTHFSRKGAKEIGRLVAQRLSLDVTALHAYLRQPWQVPQD